MSVSVCKKIMLALSIAGMLVPLAAVHAKGQMNSSETSSLLVGLSAMGTSGALLSPITFSFEGSQNSLDRHQKNRRSANEQAPDMNVEEVGEDENGDPHVRLQDPNNPEHVLVLTWPKRKGHNPASGFRRGHLIAFQPNPQRSGWLLRDPAGHLLAFVPVPDMVSGQSMELF